MSNDDNPRTSWGVPVKVWVIIGACVGLLTGVGRWIADDAAVQNQQEAQEWLSGPPRSEALDSPRLAEEPSPISTQMPAPAPPPRASMQFSQDAFVRESPAKEWNTLTPRYKREMCSDYRTFGDGIFVRQFWLTTNTDDLDDILDFLNAKC